MLLAILLVLSFTLTFLLTQRVRKISLKYKLLDYPVERSSHSTITPRGGGLAIVIVFTGALACAARFGLIAVDVFTTIIVGAMLVALVGWLDDIGKANAWFKLCVHFCAAIWIIDRIGGFNELSFGFATFHFGLLGSAAAVLAAVWIINLYNFMDGIDGIATTEAVFVSATAGFIFWLKGMPSLANVLWILAAAALGFLKWNWPPAKIFMGDVGSGFFGFVFAATMFIGARQSSPSFIWIWLILLGSFVADATITLLRRIRQGSRWNQAHKRHAYQHLARAKGHKNTTIAITALNICWLAPLALLASILESSAFMIACIATIPLCLAALHFKAGLKNE